MRIATWNLNSIKARRERLLAWLERWQPDALCLQELKCEESAFPWDAVQQVGYHSVALGQRTYNGVAILSRHPATEVQRGLDDGVDDPQARLIAARIADVTVVCVYVPNGQSAESDKFAYKLRWLARLRSWLDRHHCADLPLAVCGDFNVAPDDRDVANPPAWQHTVLCLPEVRAAYQHVMQFGLHDSLRLHHQENGLYSWWDYRRLGFARNDGLRIDTLLVTAPLAARCQRVQIDRDERKGALPSDHAPVVAEFATTMD